MANRLITQVESQNALLGAVVANFMLNKLDRILEYKDSDEVTVKGSNRIPLLINSKWFYIDTDTDLSTATDLDTGAVAAGTDYYVYACDNSGTLVFLISAASTFPAGYDANTSRKIGGFHTVSAAVGTIASHDLTDHPANGILPASVWDLKHRAKCGNNAGMVYDEGTGIWVDIYLASGTGASTVSANGRTISDMRTWMDFVDDGHAVGKRLLTDEEFASIAAGSNEETNIVGSADPVTTGGHSDTASRRMISNIGCEDCCGALYQWLSEGHYRYDADVVPTFTTAAKTATITHDASPGGNPIYLKYDEAGNPYLCCNMATDAVDKIVTFGSSFTVRITHDADAATGGIQVYFDEDATQPNRLLAALPGLKSEYLRTSNPTSWLSVTYNATPGTPGVAVSFDDGADERLEFTSPTTTNGTLDLCYILSPTLGYYDLPGARGSLYRQGSYGDVRVRAGGDWGNGTRCGSRCRIAVGYRWDSNSLLGARFASEPL